MTDPTSPPARGAGCPPAFDLEAYSAGELPALKAHVDGCAECTRYVRELADAAKAFVAQRPAELFLKQVERREPSRKASPLRFLVPVFAGLAAALLVTVTVLNLRRDDDLTLKGSAFRVLVKRGDAREAVVSNDALIEPGDRLRFSFTPPAEGNLVIFELDGTEAVSVAFGPKPVKPSDSGVLEGTVTFDDSPGPEWLVAVFSTEALDAEQLAQQLRGQSKRGAVTLQCSECRVEALRVQKRTPSPP